MTIRIVIADDHALFVGALERFLRDERDFEVVGTATDSAGAVQLIQRIKPDIAIVDVRMPPDGGLAVARAVRDEELATKVVILTAALSDTEAAVAMKLGVRGVILKEMSPVQLVRCIRKVHSGGEWIERSSASKAITQILSRETSARDLQTLLTPREYEVLRVAAAGLPNREIAAKLSIGEGTVKMHLHSIYEKLSLRGRVDLMAFAHKHGLTE